jgi:hypothetical protein
MRYARASIVKTETSADCVWYDGPKITIHDMPFTERFAFLSGKLVTIELGHEVADADLSSSAFVAVILDEFATMLSAKYGTPIKIEGD